MKDWANIVITAEDPEIIRINKLENDLGNIPDIIRQIRELITRFEVCHFKYKKHLGNIRASIAQLRPYTVPDEIGIHHIHHGENDFKSDKTGRSLLGQQYLWALIDWTGDKSGKRISDQNALFNHQIQIRLGENSPEKIQIVRLLIARLKWDWKSYEILRQGNEHKELKLQVCSMDICHYSFPSNLDLLLDAIGRMQPARDFEGCGTFNQNIKLYLEEEFTILNDNFRTLLVNGKSDHNDLVRAWLTACLAKTIKEALSLQGSIDFIST